MTKKIPENKNYWKNVRRKKYCWQRSRISNAFFAFDCTTSTLSYYYNITYLYAKKSVKTKQQQCEINLHLHFFILWLGRLKNILNTHMLNKILTHSWKFKKLYFGLLGFVNYDILNTTSTCLNIAQKFRVTIYSRGMATLSF